MECTVMHELSQYQISRYTNAVIIDEMDNKYPIEIVFQYTTTDPTAVHMRMRMRTTNRNEHAVWVVARSLFMQGMHAYAGIGDVQIWSTTNDKCDFVVIRLSRPDGVAMCRVPLHDVEVFLQRTLDLIPEELEDLYVDIDHVIHQLLQQ